ncbi:unnamed protein product [Fraxinus pennsylvanica]|uniref:Uncharacterized protein n=1 Tax=Fraxinus pennsylvanica TaxID=56036 RepID=A0AAD1ZEZ8_9LAMI|nr:unnamed protein product [Fraxinus pennsylvanica]
MRHAGGVVWRVRFPFSSLTIHGMNSWSPSSELNDLGDSEFGEGVCRNLDSDLSLGFDRANLIVNSVAVEKEEHVMRVRRRQCAMWDRKVGLERRRVVKTQVAAAICGGDPVEC